MMAPRLWLAVFCWAVFVVSGGDALMSDWLSKALPWFFALLEPQQKFLLVAVPTLATLITTLFPPVRRWFRRRLIWRGSPLKVKMNPYGTTHSADTKHFIVFPDVTITNRGSDPESVNAELLIPEQLDNYKHQHVVQPEPGLVPGWNEQVTWFKRNEPIRFPLNLGPKEAVHGHIAFCVWTMPGEVPESRNESEFRIVDLATDKTIHRSKQSGMTMLLGSFRSFSFTPRPR